MVVGGIDSSIFVSEDVSIGRENEFFDGSGEGLYQGAGNLEK